MKINMWKNRPLLLNLFASVGILSLICSTVHAQQPFQDGRTVNKSYEVNPDAWIDIKGKYGNIHINTWDRSTAEVSIELNAKGDIQDDVVEILDRIKIELDGNKEKVSIHTELPGVSHWNVTTENGEPRISAKFKDGTEIKLQSFNFSYTLNIPRTNNLKVDSRFGDLYLDNIEGNTDINLKYANLQVKNLNGPSKLTLSYSKGRVGEIVRGNWSVLHSDLNISSAEYLKLFTQYSEISIEKADSLISDSKYNTYQFGQVNYLMAEEKNSELSVQNLGNWGDIHMEYGKLAVKNLNKKFQNLNLEGSFTDMDIQIEPGAQYSLQLSSKYANIAFPERLSISQDVETEDSRKIIGSLGSTSKSNIHISARHGEILIK